MKFKPLIVMVLILAAAGLILTIFRDPPPPEEGVGTESRLLPGLQTDEVAGIEISRGGRRLRLSRRNGEWVIETAWDHPASASTVENLLLRLQAITAGHPVTSSRQHHPLFEVGAEGYLVNLLDHSGRVRHALVVGKRGEDMLSSFVRRADSDEVFLWRESLNWVVNVQTDRWISRDLPGVAAVDCRAFSVKTADGEYRWERDDDAEWRPVSPKAEEIGGRRAGELLALLLAVRPLELAGPFSEFRDRFESPFLVYEFNLFAGGGVKVVVGEKEANRYYFRVKGTPYAYRVGASPLAEAARRLEPRRESR